MLNAQFLIGLTSGGGLILLGMLVGRFRRPKPEKPPVPKCTCKHMLSDHDPQTKRCHGTRARPSRYDLDGFATAYEDVPCTCRQYIGPRPVEDFFAVPMLPPEEK